MINKEIEIDLLLDDIDEIIDATIMYFNNPKVINDVDELYSQLLSINERIMEIKNLLLKEN